MNLCTCECACVPVCLCSFNGLLIPSAFGWQINPSPVTAQPPLPVSPSSSSPATLYQHPSPDGLPEVGVIWREAADL